MLLEFIQCQGLSLITAYPRYLMESEEVKVLSEPQFVQEEEDSAEEDPFPMEINVSDLSSDECEDGENAPQLQERQREAAVARMHRFFGLDMDETPEEPLVQDDSNYIRKMYWSCIQDSGFPHRVNHAVASHRFVWNVVGVECSGCGSQGLHVRGVWHLQRGGMAIWGGWSLRSPPYYVGGTVWWDV